MQFIVFGLAHAVYLSINHAWRIFVGDESRLRRLLPMPASIGLTFLCVLVGQIFFRADSVHSAMHVMGSMIGLHPGGGLAALAEHLPTRASFAASSLKMWLNLAFAYGIIWALPNTQEILSQVEETERKPALLLPGLRWRPNAAWGLVMIVLTAATLTMMYASTSFLYFQF